MDKFNADVKNTWDEGNCLPFYGGKPKISSNYLSSPKRQKMSQSWRQQ